VRAARVAPSVGGGDVIIGPQPMVRQVKANDAIIEPEDMGEPQDMDPAEMKRRKRLLRNRMSAQLHRERQRTYLEGLQKQVAALTAERDVLRSALDAVVTKASSVASVPPQELLEEVPLPLAAEEIAAPPVFPAGQTSRTSADSGDVMLELLSKARSQILPRTKSAAAALLESTALRLSSGVTRTSPASSVSTSCTRRVGKRRSSVVVGEEGDAKRPKLGDPTALVDDDGDTPTPPSALLNAPPLYHGGGDAVVRSLPDDMSLDPPLPMERLLSALSLDDGPVFGDVELPLASDPLVDDPLAPVPIAAFALDSDDGDGILPFDHDGEKLAMGVPPR
jgi:hypothetical protein